MLITTCKLKHISIATMDWNLHNMWVIFPLSFIQIDILLICNFIFQQLASFWTLLISNILLQFSLRIATINNL